MYPDQQGGTQSPYDFILNPAKPPRKNPLSLSGGSMKMKLAVILGGAIILVIVIAIAGSLLTPKSNVKQNLISLAETQNELIRISNTGDSEAVQQVTKNLAITVQYTLQSQQQQVVKLLGSSGTKVNKKQLTLKQNATTDQQFTNAQQTSTFDTTYAKVAQDELTSYGTELKQIYGSGVSTTVQNMMSDFYQQTQLLISQIPYTQNTINAAGQ